jgi:hypothetical protein
MRRPPDSERGPVAGAPSKLLDPEELEAEDNATAQVLAGIHGGQRRAAHWLRKTLEAVTS